MKKQPQSVVLEGKTLRQRQLSDAAGVAPFFGVILLCIPAIWGNESKTAVAMIYVFSVWALLILLMALIGRRLTDAPPLEENPSETAPPQEP